MIAPIRAERVAALALLAALGCARPEPAPAQTRIRCRVTAVSDGDTFRAACPASTRVRLLLIDAPERDQRPFGPEARARLLMVAPPGTMVTLELDVAPRDQYGRLLAYVWLADGRMVNEELTRAGFAIPLVYPPNVRYVERIRRAAGDARAARRGLWAESGFECSPKEHRQHRC